MSITILNCQTLKMNFYYVLEQNHVFKFTIYYIYMYIGNVLIPMKNECWIKVLIR